MKWVFANGRYAMTLFDQRCPYCQGELASLTQGYCPHCGVMLKGKQTDLDTDRVEALRLQAAKNLADDNWVEGIYLLIDALRLQPENELVKAELMEARRKFRLMRMYEWAQENYYAGKYDEALVHLREILLQDDDYKDVLELIKRIEEKKLKKRSKKNGKTRKKANVNGILTLFLLLLLFVFAVVMLVGMAFLWQIQF